MTATMFQALRAVTHQATGIVSRRRSLLALSGAALVAHGAFPSVSLAKRKKGKNCKKQENQRCSSDAAACKNTVALGCDPNDPTNCAAEKECCDTCSANGFITCLLLLNT